MYWASSQDYHPINDGDYYFLADVDGESYHARLEYWSEECEFYDAKYGYCFDDYAYVVPHPIPHPADDKPRSYQYRHCNAFYEIGGCYGVGAYYHSIFSSRIVSR